MRTVILGLSFCMAAVVQAQQRIVDSLTQELHTANNDTLRLVIYNGLCNAYSKVNYDSSLVYAQHYLKACQQLDYKLHEVDALLQNAASFGRLSSTAHALELSNKAQEILEQEQNPSRLLPARYLTLLHIPQKQQTPSRYRIYLTGKMYLNLSATHYIHGSQSKGRLLLTKALGAATSIEAADLLSTAYLFLGIMLAYTKPDSALYYLKKSYPFELQVGYMQNLGNIYDYTAKAYRTKGDHAMELQYKRLALQYGLQQQDLSFTGWSFIGMADYFNETKATDSALFYGRQAFQMALRVQDDGMMYWSSRILKDTYKALNNIDSAFAYTEHMLAANEKISSDASKRRFQDIDYNQQLQQQAVTAARVQYRNNVRTYGFLAGSGVLLLIAAILWRNNQHRKRAYAILQQQKARTEQALQELKMTQSQLIQSEKMASLGELTAGIAHEIQNPLNFINNFSEVNSELIDDVEQVLDNGNLDDAKAILGNVKGNEQKISHHGKRADAIVKNMLQHSRKNTGQKESVNINVLCDEYLRLSFYGLRAKDKTFNANFKTGFDESIGKINIVPQDIGRVLLNLFNNAFYAVHEHLKKLGGNYKPTVVVRTKKINGNVEIHVQDNGMGISKSLQEKIFQPFFTTKPTGQGTGLGLSLSYDIIKAHGGELKVESKEGEGATFIIILPV